MKNLLKLFIPFIICCSMLSQVNASSCIGVSKMFLIGQNI